MTIASGQAAVASDILAEHTADGQHKVKSGLDAGKAAVPVVGNLYLATDTKKFYTCATAGTWSAFTMPPKVIVFLNDTVANCPAGWAENTAIRGRTIVGMPASGTKAGTVGTALTDLLDRTHTHTGPSHQHTTTLNGDSGTLRDAYQTFGQENLWKAHCAAGADLGSTSGAYADWALTQSGGTGNTGTAATSNVMPYIQYPAIEKS